MYWYTSKVSSSLEVQEGQAVALIHRILVTESAAIQFILCITMSV